MLERTNHLKVRVLKGCQGLEDRRKRRACPFFEGIGVAVLKIEQKKIGERYQLF